MSKNERKPSIRFEGFNEAWEQCKYKDIFDYERPDKYIVKSDKYEAGNTTPVLTANKGFILGYTNETRTYNNPCIIFDDFTLDSKYVDFKFMVKSSAMKILTAKKDNNLYFAFNRLNSSKLESLGHARHYISVVQESDTLIPNFEEQNKLSELFKRIEDLITLHQRKVESLSNIKKALLEKMFPAIEERTPKIRFAGFSEAWEQCKFSDITYFSGIKNKNDDPYESYSISNEFGFIPQNEQFEHGGTMSSADKTMYYIVEPNSFAYNPARINIGSIGYQNLSKNVIVSSLYEVFKTTDNVDDRFLWHWFKTWNFQKQIEQFQEGGVRLYFYYDKLCMSEIMLPSYDEQNKIGHTLDMLDNLIALHQRKCEKLKNIKKALLEKMFV